MTMLNPAQQHVADHGLGLAAHGDSLDRDFAFIGDGNVIHHPDGGRFTGAVRAQNPEDPAGFHGKANAVYRSEITKFLGDVLDV